MFNKLILISLLISSTALTAEPLVHGKCLDPDVKEDQNLLTKINNNLKVKIYHQWLDEGKGDYTNLNKESLWYDAEDAAEEITSDYFVCDAIAVQYDI